MVARLLVAGFAAVLGLTGSAAAQCGGAVAPVGYAGPAAGCGTATCGTATCGTAVGGYAYAPAGMSGYAVSSESAPRRGLFAGRLFGRRSNQVVQSSGYAVAPSPAPLTMGAYPLTNGTYPSTPIVLGPTTAPAAITGTAVVPATGTTVPQEGVKPITPAVPITPAPTTAPVAVAAAPMAINGGFGACPTVESYAGTYTGTARRGLFGRFRR